MPELLILMFVIAAIFGLPTISGLFARSMGRPFWMWFGIGCLLPYIGYYLVLSSR